MPNAIEMLREDHKKVQSLFRSYEAAPDSFTKRSIVETILAELTIHADLEQEVFYPAMRARPEGEEMVSEAIEEHALIKDLCDQLQDMDPADMTFDAKVKVLMENVEHHIEEEESQLLPLLGHNDPDAERLGDRMWESKRRLMDQPGAQAVSGTRRL